MSTLYSKYKKYKKSIFICLGLIILIALYFFNPENTKWLPKCPVYLLTGYKCPSCGIQRAVYQLLHGNFHAAFLQNAFLIIAIPYAILLIIVTWFDPKNKLIPLKKFCYHHITVYIFLIMAGVWMIVRNIWSL